MNINTIERLGTKYGGWYVPANMGLLSDSIIYSAGAGEDISFDLLLSQKYGSNIILIDPTIRSKTHYDEVVNFYKTNQWNFSGDIQADYQNIISGLNPSLDKFKFLEIGLWKEKGVLKFYRQDNPTYVSQTLIHGMFGKNYDEVSVDSIKNIMEANNHNRIDLLKLDVEGAEVSVINQMLDDKVHPKYLCVEFDSYLKGRDTVHSQILIRRLISSGYTILIDDNLNITFKRQQK